MPRVISIVSREDENSKNRSACQHRYVKWLHTYMYLYIHRLKRNRFHYVDLAALDVEAEIIDRLDSQRGDVKRQWKTLHANVLARVSYVGRIRDGRIFGLV